MGIAASVLETVQRHVSRYPRSRASKVGLRIGEYAGVEAESLRFCFEALARGAGRDPMILEIDWRPRSDELDLAFLELEDEP
jgi:hydrogenase nickel incorporation protein HypA/HybF